MIASHEGGLGWLAKVSRIDRVPRGLLKSWGEKGWWPTGDPGSGDRAYEKWESIHFRGTARGLAD